MVKLNQKVNNYNNLNREALFPFLLAEDFPSFILKHLSNE
jgi:hypothetical protein